MQTATDQLSNVFSALADPTRRAILANLIAGERTVTDLAAPFDISQPAISKHLKVLESAGLISRERSAQYRPCKLQAGPLKNASDWIERYREQWEQRLDRLDEYLKGLQESENRQKAKKQKSKSGKSTSRKHTPRKTGSSHTKPSKRKRRA